MKVHDLDWKRAALLLVLSLGGEAVSIFVLLRYRDFFQSIRNGGWWGESVSFLIAQIMFGGPPCFFWGIVKLWTRLRKRQPAKSSDDEGGEKNSGSAASPPSPK